MSDFSKLAERQDCIVTFGDFLRACSSEPDLVAEFDRLRGTNLSRRGTGLDLMIDDATGRTDADCREWIEFCADLWERIPMVKEC